MSVKAIAVLALLASTPAVADPTFTKEEARAIYTLGSLNAAVETANANLRAFADTPAAKSALAKMNPPPSAPPKHP